ncbi:hypothetical protein [Rhizobium rhizogenes]|jgi:uncharacterized membrane protein YhaH (DUF805 family)|uniref:hypothetical protein n=1 Tax=Rhizobium rhizogenes TaxID=359 RepID=UPI0022C38825|nr:hypothetical protein [Rhizobium rhizogenes]MCZ7464135.1 hypothetical protein [Rhizobium rhizogenes]
MRSISFWVWLLALAVPVISLVAAQYDTNSGGSIGGGGYDLGPFLYSWLLIIVTAVWSLCTFVAALNHRDRAARIRAFCLTAIGTGTFVIVFLFYGQNLS